MWHADVKIRRIIRLTTVILLPQHYKRHNIIYTSAVIWYSTFIQIFSEVMFSANLCAVLFLPDDFKVPWETEIIQARCLYTIRIVLRIKVRRRQGSQNQARPARTSKTMLACEDISHLRVGWPRPWRIKTTSVLSVCFLSFFSQCLTCFQHSITLTRYFHNRITFLDSSHVLPTSCGAYFTCVNQVVPLVFLRRN